MESPIKMDDLGVPLLETSKVPIEAWWQWWQPNSEIWRRWEEVAEVAVTMENFKALMLLGENHGERP